MSPRKHQKRRDNELKVFISHQPDGRCGECDDALGRGAWIFLAGEKGALCLSCADLEHLVFLPSGDAALTRRSKKNSTLWAVVLKFSQARKRYERQGLLVEEQALRSAETECLADADAREAARERRREREAELDSDYVDRFATRLRELYPGCPSGREREIAEHAGLKYSGRVGRSAAAKGLDEEAIRLALQAHVRHAETKYDRLLAHGCERHEARHIVRAEVDRILDCWAQPT